MRRVLEAGEMQALDRQASACYGIPSLLLMENAGGECARALCSAFPSLSGGVLVFAGRGNNGGDGFVIARRLFCRGIPVHTVLAGSSDEVRGDARTNLDILRQMHAPLHEVAPGQDVGAVEQRIASADVVVDALLGTGTQGGARGIAAQLIDIINRSEKPVLSVDVPSGLCADLPMPNGPAVHATLTVTFAYPKPCLVLPPAADHAGRVEVVDIGIPCRLAEASAPRLAVFEAGDARAAFPGRATAAHKGSFGHVLVVAGSPGKTGAAAMAGLAVLRTGGGLVTVAVPQGVHQVVATKVTEAMTAPLPQTDDGFVGRAAQEVVERLAVGKGVVAIGPGLGTHPETRALVQHLVRTLPVAMVIDADALNALAGQVDSMAAAPAARILTPHPGECARLLDLEMTDVLRGRVAIVRGTATRTGSILVFKMAGTLVGDAQGLVTINPTGNPGMATGGAGDVLTGVIAGLLAQGASPELAARAGAFVHGAAGDLAAARLGETGLIAGDILDAIPSAIESVVGAGHGHA